jgi:hypothetical protein
MTAFRSQLTIAALLVSIACSEGQVSAQEVASQRKTGIIEAAKIVWEANAANRRHLEIRCDDAGSQHDMQLIHFTDSQTIAACDCGRPRCHGACLDPGHPKKPKRTMPGDVDRGDCPPLRYRISDCQRAGDPHSVHRLAKCATDSHYSASYVGGGAAFCWGRCRKATEGTWGLDYSGLLGHANVWLKYTRGRKQGGEGAYATDGEPKLVSKVKHLIESGH